MPTYTINGKRISTDKVLTEAEIDEIAAELGTSASAPQVPPPMGAQTASQIPTGGVQAPMTQTEAPSGFMQGLLDPFRGGAQLVAKSLGALGSDYFKGEAQRMDESMQAQEAAYQQQRAAAGQEGFDAPRLAGNVFNPANLLGGFGATPFRQAVSSGAVTGALQPVLTEEDFLTEKGKQLVAGSAGGVLGAGVTKVAGLVLNPLTSKAEQTMRDLGVQLTPGQVAGGSFKDIESFAASVPLVGSYISEAKERALYSFNKGVINKALAKVNEKLPEDVIGRDAVQVVNEIVDKKYTDVLSKMSFKLDFPTYTGLLKATKLPSSSVDRVRVKDELDSIIFSRLPKEGPVDGEVYKQIESQLRQRAAQLGRGTVSDQDVGDALRQASVSLKEGLRKQNPKYNSELRRIDSAYGDISVMKAAAANTGAENGVFTPRQYKTAVRQSDTTRKKTQFAAGTARGQDVAEDAVSVMEPRQTANLEGRIALSNVGGYTMAANPATAIPMALAAPVLYSESGVKLMNALMRSRPDVVRQVGEALTKRATKEGSISAAQVMEEYKRQTQAQE
jgi:hypothetical protein